MPSLKHIHTYRKYKARPGYWRCGDPICTHFTEEENVLDKLSKCNLCGAEFILKREDIRRVKPRCFECSNTNKANEAKRVKELVKNMNFMELKQIDGGASD